jgi:hypothetical protein
MIQEGKDGTPQGIFTYSPMQFAPRLGFAFDPVGKGRTALRGGAGVFYERLQSGPLYTMITNPPTVYTPTAYYGTLPDLQQAVNGGMKGPTNIKTIFGQVPIATVYNYSFGVQQQIGHNMVADVSYVGSISRHLSYTRNLNGVPWGSQFLDLHPENRDPTTTSSALSTNFLRPYTAFGDISNVQFGGTANYNSLQAQLSRRFRNGFGFGTSYTFSKALGVSDGSDTAVSFLLNPRERNYGPLTYDRTHVFSTRYNYELPRVGRRLGNRLLGAVTDGWELAGTYRAMSGQLFTPGLATADGENFTGTPSEGARTQVLDPDAPVVTKFTRPASRTLGNAGVGIIRAPGLNNFDTSIYRQIRFAERKSLQLRFESYNTFNHTQFSNVNRTARFDKTGAQIDPTFYTPTNAYSARRLQLAMTLNW